MQVLKFFDPSGPKDPYLTSFESLRYVNSHTVEDIDINNTELTSQYNVQTAPTILLVDGDQVVKRYEGIQSIQELRLFLNIDESNSS